MAKRALYGCDMCACIWSDGIEYILSFFVVSESIKLLLEITAHI